MLVTAPRGVARALAALGTVALLLAGMLALSSPAQAQKIRTDFFGMHDSQVRHGSVPGVPVGVVRLWDSETSWRHVEPSPGAFDFTGLDAAVTTARNAGLRPMIVLGQTPSWHAENPGASGAYGSGASSMPRIPAWERYVAAVANRYGTSVDYQIWNEPNVGSYYSGSVAGMVKLTVTASRQITAALGRGATVVAPSFPLRLKSQQNWFRKYWAAKVGRKSVANYVDVVAANLYPAANQAPEAQLKLLGIAKRLLPKPARRKALWNTEINYGLLGGARARQIPEAKQAAYVARTLALNAGSSVRRVYWYAWGIGSIANTHLVENDRSTLTRAGRTWGVVRGWLTGTNTTGCRRASVGKLRGLYTCTARMGRREVRRIYWKPTGRAARITTHRTTTRWETMDGRSTTRRGKLRLKVGQAPVMVSSRQ